MPKRSLAVLGLVSAVGLAPAHARDFDGLKPGKFVEQKLTVPVRVVLIGFRPGQVSDATVRSFLPATYTPVARYPNFYGPNVGRDLGLEYHFRYDILRKGRDFSDAFFERLRKIGTKGDIAPFQQAYNDQANNILDVTGPVLYIDAPRVEKWLDENDNGPRDDRGYTVYFINWWGRDDFKFHVYTKTDEPDPDTNYNFGIERGSRKMVGWGGSSSRRWFYDFSAGPEAWAGNYDVDDADVDGDGLADYRIPPIWEYAAKGYRAPGLLSGDIGRLTRYVAIDLLFTTSPLYDPLVTAPAAGGSKTVHVAMLEDEPGVSGLDFYDRAYARSKWRKFEPYYSWKAGLSDTNPIDDASKHAFDVFVGNVADPSACYVPFGDTFAELFCFFADHFSDYIPAYPARDYVEKVFAFDTNDPGLGGLLGFADDDWATGTQTFVFMFDGVDSRDLGYGFTTTGIHEVGHHLGMSHPHDGYDAETGLDFDSVGPFYFAWAGDESNTVMHYIALSNGFGQFDQDNMYRWETAGYLNWANRIAGDILNNSNRNRVLDALQRADDLARKAKDELESWDYLRAAAHAREAYVELAVAADRIGAVPPFAPTSLQRPAASVRHQICRARYIRG
jgi:hypothetical protein